MVHIAPVVFVLFFGAVCIAVTRLSLNTDSFRSCLGHFKLAFCPHRASDVSYIRNTNTTSWLQPSELSAINPEASTPNKPSHTNSN